MKRLREVVICGEVPCTEIIGVLVDLEGMVIICRITMLVWLLLESEMSICILVFLESK
jgi:hypothetical protein